MQKVFFVPIYYEQTKILHKIFGHSWWMSQNLFHGSNLKIPLKNILYKHNRESNVWITWNNQVKLHSITFARIHKNEIKALSRINGKFNLSIVFILLSQTLNLFYDFHMKTLAFFASTRRKKCIKHDKML